MKTYFEVNFSLKRITEVEIEKETPAFIWINGDRTAKSTEYRSYVESKEMAKSMLLFHLEKAVRLAEKELEERTKELESFKII